MCDPLTIGGLALSAGSMAANTMAQNKIAKARSGAMAAERMRQQQYEAEAQGLNDKSRKSYDGFGGQQADKASSLAGMFKQDAPVQTGETAPQSASNIVVREQAKQGEKAKAYGDQQATALGNLRSFGDVMGGLGRSQARDAMGVAQIGGFMRGSANVLPYELEAANSKGNGMKMFGDLLGAGGQIAMGMGLRGGGGITMPGIQSNPIVTRPTGLGFGLQV
jgi:hypothetical protein